MFFFSSRKTLENISSNISFLPFWEILLDRYKLDFSICPLRPLTVLLYFFFCLFMMHASEIFSTIFQSVQSSYQIFSVNIIFMSKYFALFLLYLPILFYSCFCLPISVLFLVMLFFHLPPFLP